MTTFKTPARPRAAAFGTFAAAVSLAALAAGAAHAQDALRVKAAKVPLTPMTHSLPAAMTDPLPLSGSMLRPLDVSATGSLAAENTTSALDTGALEASAVDTGAVDTGAARRAAVRKLAQAEAPQSEAAVAAVPSDLAPAEPAAEALAPAVEPSLPTGEMPGVVSPPPPALQPKPAEAPKPEVTSVDVIVENVESSEGVVNVALCDKALSNAGCPYHTEVPAAPGFVEARFNDVPPGRYAVVGYHDVNKNDEFDKMLGVPREPYALSGAAGKKMVPTFKDAALTIKKGENTVVIKLQRLLGG